MEYVTNEALLRDLADMQAYEWAGELPFSTAPYRADTAERLAVSTRIAPGQEWLDATYIDADKTRLRAQLAEIRSAGASIVWPDYDGPKLVGETVLVHVGGGSWTVNYEQLCPAY